MTSVDPAESTGDPGHTDHLARRRWAAVRQIMRAAVAARRNAALAQHLLPIDASEAGATRLAPPDLPATFAGLAASYPALLADSHRKQHGAWFTTQALAAPTVARTLEPLLEHGDPRRLRICDPAVGGGTFLLAALHTLVAAGLRARDAVRCLHGVDVDSTAAALAALALCEACGDEQIDAQAVAAQVHAGDGLLDLEPGTFDAVLTNPPWETLQSGAGAAARVAELRPHFRHQGRGKLFTYRLFVERAHQLLRDGGRFGLIVPASLWFDRDAEPLRRLLLDHSDWQWLFGFENRQKLFAIDSRYRFAAIVGTKGGPTTYVRTTFGRVDAADWAAAEPAHTRYGRDELQALSPHSGAFVEVDDRRDLDVLRRMQRHGRALLGPDGAFVWRQGDFNMTADRAQFVLRAEAEHEGYRRGDDAVWRAAGRPDLLPLYQGAMVHDLHPNAAAHAGGTGHATAWQAPARLDDLQPAYLVAAQPWRATALRRARARIVLRALSNATNERTAVACLLPDQPCGNSLGVLEPRLHGARPLHTMAAGAAVLGSLAFDWSVRMRLGGTNLNGFVLADCWLPHLDEPTGTELAQLALRLCAVLPWHAPLWQQARTEGWCDRLEPAVADEERRELATAIDVLAGRAFGLHSADVAWIVRGCELPAPGRRGEGAGHSKGFWRIDRELAPERRRPLRWLARV
ncbi:MAG TPA: N-6 DNA methylase [Planctomycetota bacterium]|nr:N-6 DNA methylase [Planctomycetota bacterium]